MRKTVFRKIKSERGASLSVALLLFLVCAAVGAVVLTAAASAAGRFSERAKMDQRYYTVSSAAEFLANQLCGKEVKIERIKTTTTDTNMSYDGTGEVSVGSPVTTVAYSTKLNNNELGAAPSLSFLSSRAVALLYGSNLAGQNGVNTEAAMGYTFSNAEDGSAHSLSIKHGQGFSELDVDNISWTMLSDGTLEFKIGKGDAKNSYRIVLTLVPEIEENVKTVESAPSITSTATGYKKTTITTLTKTSTIKWKVGGIRKEVSQPNAETSGNG